jgi:hypothetical protein
MAKVEIEFESDWETGALISRPIGRLNLGGHVARIMLCSDGLIRIALPDRAKEDGTVIWFDQSASETALWGFGRAPETVEGKPTTEADR